MVGTYWKWKDPHPTNYTYEVTEVRNGRVACRWIDSAGKEDKLDAEKGYLVAQWKLMAKEVTPITISYQMIVLNEKGIVSVGPSKVVAT
jgi:hypothetical protein